MLRTKIFKNYSVLQAIWIFSTREFNCFICSAIRKTATLVNALWCRSSIHCFFWKNCQRTCVCLIDFKQEKTPNYFEFFYGCFHKSIFYLKPFYATPTLYISLCKVFSTVVNKNAFNFQIAYFSYARWTIVRLKNFGSSRLCLGQMKLLHSASPRPIFLFLHKFKHGYLRLNYIPFEQSLKLWNALFTLNIADTIFPDL